MTQSISMNKSSIVKHKKSHRIQNEPFCKMLKWGTNKTDEPERFTLNASLLCYVFIHGRIIVSSMYTYTWCIRIYVIVWKKAQKCADITSEQGTVHSMKWISLHCLNYSSINNANRCDYLLSCQSIGLDANTLILCERTKRRGRHQEYQMNSSMLDCSHWQRAGRWWWLGPHEYRHIKHIGNSPPPVPSIRFADNNYVEPPVSTINKIDKEKKEKNILQTNRPSISRMLNCSVFT